MIRHVSFALIALLFQLGCTSSSTPPAHETGTGGKDSSSGSNTGSSNNVGGSDSGAGGSDPSTDSGGADSGVGGMDPGTGGTDPGTGGADPGIGGTDPGIGGTGSASAGGTGTGGGSGGENSDSYALPAPSECSNRFSVDGCIQGDASSECEGKCANDFGSTSKNACEGGKEGMPVQFACSRDILFSPEMEQALLDDGYEAGSFHYAIVGHDPDQENLDSGLPNSCCQCYQLVFDKPTYLTNSTLTPPPPLIVQSANSQASGPTGFDVFMGAGGFGAFNACSAEVPEGTMNGHYLYEGYPAMGQAFSGGVKPGPDSMACDQEGNLSDALIADDSCQEKIEDACNEITANNAKLQEVTRSSCIESNSAESYYHENWDIYAKRVACPTHLMEVTGCKIPQEGLPAADPEIQTATQAAAAGFSSGYHTTTMQDCCMPTCAWSNNVQVDTVDGYSSFYSCDANDLPITQ